MTETKPESNGYLKPKSRYLFWLFLGYQIVRFVLVVSQTFPHENIFLSAITGLIWATIILLYSLRCNILKYQVIFAVFTGVSLFETLYSCILTLTKSRLFYIKFHGELENGYWTTSIPFTDLAVPIIFLVAFALILTDRKAGKILICATALTMLNESIALS